ncbi:type I DNA topoisomerase [Sphaerochaeta halotolerans]|jgi:DNA topoisomerase-1|uniref:DNA topoisomerase 1 n=1 Tax=Sphaerochaeta halotolerans TaxID=2293840 RepID=A0A372MJH5_9SPIR|nr:type I DNA topoisomerase [Sphaerochaeta halotolerans]RFU95931.1 type I DNA topoisomerase [Sphaerochaeta halotolerans]
MDNANTLIIVESPTKARTISKFLPSNCKVVASKGHIRDLPEDRMAIDVEKGFACEYQIVAGKQSLIKELKSSLKTVDRLLLATDEDREGESISWHLLEVLKPKVPHQRMVFHEITKKAITDALDHGRDLDENLVQAQESRRVVDRLYGYTLSPTLWKKLSNKRLSAGRVQSVGLRLTVDRERLRIAFSQSTYFDAKAQLLSVSKQAFEAKITAYAGQPIATGKDFDSTTGVYKGKENTLLLDEERAKAIVKELSSETFIVEDIQKKPFVTRPSIPFTTSTLQQDAIKKLHISASETMRIAQRLYENGYITYMRTDSPSLSQEGTNAARDLVNQLYGKEYLSPSPRYFAAKSVGAQEAHEAIRPAGERFAVPSETSLSGKDFALYELIWKRTLASQMADAKKATTTVTIKAGNGTFVASGTQIVFPGFIRAYVEGSDDPDAALDDKETLLPAMKAGEECALQQLEEVAHQTKSPARYTEASLVQELEKRGIGRPSTYASIIKTLLDRKYVIKDGPALVPTFMGFAVCQFLESNFPQFIDYDFTSKMEDNLDKIAAGKLDKKVFLNAFYLGEEGLENQNKLQLALDNKVVTKTLRLPQISEENPVMIGPYGPYVVDGEGQFISLPNTWLPGTTTDEDVKTLIAEGKKVHVPVEIGKGPVHGEPVKVMNGRFGPYWQEGDGKSAVRASIPKWVQDAGKSEDLEIASRYLALPRVLGKDEQGNEVLAQKGKYGPYISCNKKTRKLNRLDKDQQLFSITLEEALELLSKEPEKGSGGKAGRGSAKASVIKELGQFEKETVALATGRYGFYLRVGNQNIALPNEYKKDEEKAGALTIDEAVAIIRAKRAKE